MDTHTYRNTDSAAAFGTEYTIKMCCYNYLMNVIKTTYKSLTLHYT